MRRRSRWLQMITLALVLSVPGTALADDTKRTSRDTSEAPSAGAIVTSEDKALGLGKRSETTRASGYRDDDESSNDKASTIINPRQSNGDESSANRVPSETEGPTIRR